MTSVIHPHPINQIKGFIFDLDGTLVTSKLDFIYLREQVGCPPKQDILRFIEGLGEAQQMVANRIVTDYELQDAQNALWIDGALPLIQYLASSQQPVAIVTRNSQPATQHKLKHHHRLFDPIVTREDAAPKPNPEALLHIAELWQLPVHQLAYVGDYLYDIQAAKNAGMLACLFAPDELPEYADQADWVFNHFSEFLAALETSEVQR